MYSFESLLEFLINKIIAMTIILQIIKIIIFVVLCYLLSCLVLTIPLSWGNGYNHFYVTDINDQGGLEHFQGYVLSR